jgi:putative oxidoreductase
MKQSFSHLIQRRLDTLQFAAPLLTRLVVGIAFFYSGHGKLQNLDGTTSFFRDLGIPFPAANALFISSLEYIGGALLIVGLGTRIFAALLSSTMIVALFTADKASFVKNFPADLSDVTPVMFLLFLIWLTLYGGGTVAVDRLVERLFLRRKTADSQAVHALINRNLA